MKMIAELKGKHIKETAWIIGSGPSLDYLTADDIGCGPVIAINRSITKVEQLNLKNPTYSMQKDGCFTCQTSCDKCYKVRPQRAALLVHKKESGLFLQDYEPRYVFDNNSDFGLPWYTFSAFVAVILSAMMGCQNLFLVSHDAFATGNTQSWMADGVYKDTDYGNGYLEQAEVLRAFEKKSQAMKLHWLTPMPKQQTYKQGKVV